jgi:hypothetical protein
MNLVLNHVYGIVYKNLKCRTTVFNGRIVAIGATTFTLRHMNCRGVVVNVVLRKTDVVKAVPF